MWRSFVVLVCGTLVYTKGDEEEASIEVPLLASAVGTEGAGTPPPEPAAADAAADPEPGAASGATDPRMPTMPIARLAAAGGACTQPIGMALSLKVGALWSWTPRTVGRMAAPVSSALYFLAAAQLQKARRRSPFAHCVWSWAEA